MIALTPKGPPAHAGGRRGARRGGVDHAPLRAVRRLRRAHRHRTSRPTRSRSVRTSSRTATCRRCSSSTRSRGGCRARSRKAPESSRASPPSSVAGSSTRTTRDRPSSAAGACRTCSSRATTRGSTRGAATTCVGDDSSVSAGARGRRRGRGRRATPVPTSRGGGGQAVPAIRLGRRRAGRRRVRGGWGTSGRRGRSARRAPQH